MVTSLHFHFSVFLIEHRSRCPTCSVSSFALAHASRYFSPGKMTLSACSESVQFCQANVVVNMYTKLGTHTQQHVGPLKGISLTYPADEHLNVLADTTGTHTGYLSPQYCHYSVHNM